MENLVETVEKKRRRARTDTVNEQLKRAKTLTEEHTKIVNQIKGKTPSIKPTDSEKVAPKPKTANTFVPAVTSTAKMNLNFGGKAPVDNFSFSAAKAPGGAAVQKSAKTSRRSLKSATMKKLPSTPKQTAISKKVAKTPTPVDSPAPNKPLLNITNKSVAVASPGKTFDIKASLAKPLNYKPYTGKLKPWEEKKKVVAEKNGGLTFSAVKKKQQGVIKGVRMNKRAELLLKKRKIE
jgi:hypothetical protein